MNSDGFIETQFSDSESDNNSISSQPKQNSKFSQTPKKPSLDIFVICKNNLPILWCHSESGAYRYILQLAWKEKGAKILENSDYNYYIVVESKSLVYLYCTFKNWLLSYDKLLAEFSYHKIKNLNK